MLHVIQSDLEPTILGDHVPIIHIERVQTFLPKVAPVEFLQKICGFIRLPGSGISPSAPASTAAAVLGPQKKLRRLPHIFSKVLELPFTSEADVVVEEDEDSLRFFVSADGLRGEVRVHTIEIHPGVMKVVVRDDGCGSDDLDNELEVGLWRFRLPPSSQPMLASAAYADGELVVTIPKGMELEEESGGVLEF